MFRRALLALAISAIVCGLALRLAHPHHALFWNDEVWTALQATGHTFADVIRFTEMPRELVAADFVAFQRPGPDGFGSFFESDPHTSPVYYALCWAAIRCLGDPILATRWLAALLACCSLPAVFLTASELLESRAAGWLAATLVAVSPAQVFLAYDARPYTLLAVTAPLATYVFLRAYRINQRRLWLAYGVAATLLVYSHLYGAFVIAAHAAYAGASRVAQRSIWSGFAGALTLTGIAAVPWLIAIGTRLEGLRILTQWLSVPDSAAESLEAWRSALLWQFATYESLPRLEQAASVAVALFVVLVVVAWIDCWRHRSRQVSAMLGVLTFSLPLALWCLDFVLGGRRFSVTRYYVASWLGLMLVVSAFATRQLERLRTPARPARLFAAASLGAIAALFPSAVHGSWIMCRSRVPEGKPDGFLQAVGDEIGQSARPVLVSPGLVSTPLVLSNLIPADATVLNLRRHVLMTAKIQQLLRDHEVFLLRPAPEIVHPEPRRSEALEIERRLAGLYRLESSAGSCCLARVLKR